VGVITTREGHEAVKSSLDWVNTDVLAPASDAVAKVDESRGIPPIEFDREWRAEAGFDNLVARTAPVFWFFFLLTGLSLFLLREKDKHIERPYSAPLYPVVPILFCCSCAWMLYQATDYVKWHALFAIVVLLLGVPLYWLSRLISGSCESGPIDVGIPRPPSEVPIKRAQSPWT